MEQEPVALGVVEGKSVTDARVPLLAKDLDTRRFELRARRLDVGHAEGDRADRQRLVLGVDVLRRGERERDVAGLELEPRRGRVRVLRQAERLAVELRGA